MSDNLVYTLLDNGIHKLYWKDVRPNAVDAFVRLYKDIEDTFPEHSVVRVLHDYRDAGRPAFYTIAKAMGTFKLRPDLHFRVAHLYSDVMYPSIVKNASVVAHFDATRKFFDANEEDIAIAWLLDDRMNE